MIECKCYFENNSNIKSIDNVSVIGKEGLSIALGKRDDVLKFLNVNKIIKYKLEITSINSRRDLLINIPSDVRVEPGAIIREGVILKKGAIILMNAVINQDAIIGENTMIDMGAVVGSNAIIGSNCHVGANSVIAGVLEPPSANPVKVGDNTFIGASSVILEGVNIGSNVIVGAMTLVNKDVPDNSLVIGIPGKIQQIINDDTRKKCILNDELRK